MKARQWIISLFTVLLMGAGVYWFLENYELREVETYSGLTGEARSNDLFATRLFLKRMGIPTERRDSLNKLPPTTTTIVLNTERYSLSRQSVERLLAWVEQGGHLITRARATSSDKQDDESESESAYKQDYLQKKLQILTLNREHFTFNDNKNKAIPVNLPNNPRTLEVELDFYHSLSSQQHTLQLATPKQHTWLVEKALGRGQVTLISHLNFIDNVSIDEYDHAEILWTLLHSQRRVPESVWLVTFDEQPSLWLMIWKHAWMLLITLALLFIFSVWKYSPRFGTLQDIPSLQRRRIAEHIQASGRFLWFKQNNGQALLIQGLQQAIHEYSVRLIPHWDSLETEQRYQQLAEHWAMPAKQLQHLLEQSSLTKNEFLLLAQLHQKLRTKS